MSKETAISNSLYSFPPKEPDGFDSLAELALDLRSSWNHATDKIWIALDSELWERTQNPWVVLRTVSRDKIKQVLSDPIFRNDVDELVRIRRLGLESPAWYQKNHAQATLSCVAYFSLEFMLSEALPIYSGGLGNVAGDQLKAASDLGVPVVGVGLLYQQGYFRQVINKDGAQESLFPYNDPGQLPISPLRLENGEWLRLEIPLPGCSLWLRAWQVQVGRVKLYLLDSNDEANIPVHRGITSELYGGGSELRLKQELVLGIGGWRLLRALGINPDVCHLNEGHAAFAVLERARNCMEEIEQPFEVALATTRAGNLFTTHTAVAAGFDRFTPALMEQYLGKYAEEKLGISLQDLLSLGRENPDDSMESFNMAYLAIRGSGGVNGVSRLHGKVSQQLFQPLFPHWPADEVPIGSVTNGVHMPTWDSAAADDLWTESCGKERWLDTLEDLERNIRRLPDDKLWKLRTLARTSLIEYTRKRLSQQLAVSGASPDTVEWANHVFDPCTLTIGFARRFATYKRPNLLLHDPERLLRLLNNSERPVQLIVAGKAHPEDKPGMALIEELTHFIRRPDVSSRVIFLSDYDMNLTEHLVQGVDVWLNTPRRPWEACGTSGMKVLVNGGINLSELDGWWAEAYTPEVGWALGDGKQHSDDDAVDAMEAEELYNLLECEVIPEFYTRSAQDIPEKWVARMRESMARLTPCFSSNRAVREYTDEHYLSAAAAYHSRVANKGKIGRQMVDWQHSLAQKWSTMHIGEVNVETHGDEQVFEVQIDFNDLDPKTVLLEIYANDTKDGARVEMKSVRQVPGAPGRYVYSASVTAARPASDYTVRAIPHFSGVKVPLEAAYIKWQR
jgi:starch phosphorylase